MQQKYLLATKDQPFVWGRSDCTLWVANFVLLRTGVDPAISFRGRYKTELDASRLIVRAGSLVDLIAPQMLRYPDGRDVVVCAFEGRDVAGLCDGESVAVKTNIGWAILPAPKILKGWTLCLCS